tara:strand:- start:313 stop:510 length:198 start_codon:yes stop_codon:yes gene_type:complete
MVRDVLAQMNIKYVKIDVPWPHQQRKEVFEASGQTTVPVMIDGDIILDNEYDIIDYLKKNYPFNS